MAEFVFFNACYKEWRAALTSPLAKAEGILNRCSAIGYKPIRTASHQFSCHQNLTGGRSQKRPTRSVILIPSTAWITPT